VSVHVKVSLVERQCLGTDEFRAMNRRDAARVFAQEPERSSYQGRNRNPGEEGTEPRPIHLDAGDGTQQRD